MRTIHRYFQLFVLATVFILGVLPSIAEKKNCPFDDVTQKGSGGTEDHREEY